LNSISYECGLAVVLLGEVKALKLKSFRHWLWAHSQYDSRFWIGVVSMRFDRPHFELIQRLNVGCTWFYETKSKRRSRVAVDSGPNHSTSLGFESVQNRMRFDWPHFKSIRGWMWAGRDFIRRSQSAEADSPLSLDQFTAGFLVLNRGRIEWGLTDLILNRFSSWFWHRFGRAILALGAGRCCL
jgi:hypothetical protein